MNPLITVIIPYYQTKAGILANSFASVLRQSALKLCPIDVIVIDDSSPVPAVAELEEVALPELCSLRIVTQANGGPAKARNRGLDEAKSTTTFIAFLDSDDCWIDSHLENALAALGDNADFYFSDFFHIAQEVSAFNRAKKIDLMRHQKIAGHGSLFVYRGDMIHQIITGNIIGTPTVVYRFDSASQLRFREEFFSAGEDYLFWIDFFRSDREIVFSSLQEVRCGRGVNIYSGAQWGSLPLLDRIINEMRYRKTLLNSLDLDKETQEFVRNKVEVLRIEFAQQIIGRIVHRKGGIWPRVCRTYFVDWRAIALFPLYLFKTYF